MKTLLELTKIDTEEELLEITGLRLINIKLKTLPKEIWNLTNLEVLYLNDNKLTTLPKEIGNLVNLEKLYLHGNSLTKLPETILELNKLRKLSINKSLKSDPVILQLLLEGRVKVELV
jgi:Leucine-rich repeat (LRR) protein